MKRRVSDRNRAISVIGAETGLKLDEVAATATSIHFGPLAQSGAALGWTILVTLISRRRQSPGTSCGNGDLKT